MIEDEIFLDLLTKYKLERTKQHYTKAKLYHMCSMCGEDNNKLGYRLKKKYVYGFHTPFMFICKECYNQLKDKE